MSKVNFTCPECGERATANLPEGKSRVACPECGARVRPEPDADDEPPRPARENARKRPPVAEVDDDDRDEEDDEARPARRRKSERDRSDDRDDERRDRRRKPAGAGVPVWAWVAGGVGLVAVVGVVLALALSGDKDGARAKAEPLKKEPAPKKEPPKKEPPKVELPPPEAPEPEPPAPEPKVEPPKPEPPKVAPEVGDIDEGWPVLPPRKRPPEVPDGPARTTVRWYAPRAGGPPLVVLDAPKNPFLRTDTAHRGPLAHELARQAVSLAAREEFGAATRDVVLGERPGDLTAYAPAGAFELTWLVVPGKAAIAAIASVAGDARREVWRVEIALPDAEVVDYARLAAALETAARGPLADALAKETKTARRGAGAPVPVPAEAETGLRAANYFDAFAAVRLLHAAARSGADPALCADLARGYANLALLTGHLPLWGVKAHKARSLLYAHRADALGAPTGRWAVAYVSCLIGLHSQALDRAKGAAAPVPAWAKVIGPACRFDHAALAALAKDPAVGPLPLVQRAAGTHSSVARVNAVWAWVDALRADPDGFRAVGGMVALTNLGIVTSVILDSPKRLSVALGSKLVLWPDLPAGTEAGMGQIRARDTGAEIALLRALDAAPAGEPALSALTVVVREERLAIIRRLSGVYEAPGTDRQAADQALRAEAGFLADHPDYDRWSQIGAPLPPDAPPRAPDGRTPDDGVYGGTTVPALAGMDHTYDEVRANLAPMDGKFPFWPVARALRVSPYAPHVPVHLIRNDWAAAQEKAAAWEKEFAAQPAVLTALGRKYDELGRHEDAERVLLAAVKLSPDLASYQRLMIIYKTVRKDEVKLLAVFEERLQRPEYYADCSRVRVWISEVYAGRKDFQTALKYAEKAAEDSGASWAMQATINYATQVGDKEKALLWGKRLAAQRFGP